VTRDQADQLLNFTGSTNVGRIIGVQAAQHLKPAVLELGGKNPLLILEEWPGPEALTVEMPGDLPLGDHRANGELFARR
jgi:acyl-CoA reductase-like NAD-dependent aldehyde dehydrogenase